MAREDGLWIQDWTTGDNLKVNTDGSLNTQSFGSYKSELKQVYWCSYVFNLANTGEKMVLYLRNPSGSGKVLRLLDVTLTLTNTVNSLAIVRFYMNPTATANGTAQTAQPGYVGGSQPAAVGLITSAPTITANGSLYLTEYVSGGTTGYSNTVDLDTCIILAANNSLLITGDPDGTNRSLSITLTWVEV